MDENPRLFQFYDEYLLNNNIDGGYALLAHPI